MAANSFSYDHPNYVERREANASSLAGAGTSALSADFRTFQAANLYNVHYYVTTAGTATGAALRVHAITTAGTTTIATTTLGTTAAGQRVSMNSTTAGISPTALTADTRLAVLGVGDTAVTAAVVYEYQAAPTGVVTAWN